MKEMYQPRRFSTDAFMKKLYASLVGDFRPYTWPTYKQRELEILEHGSISDFRSAEAPGRFKAPPYLFKMEAQLENLFKRYRFETDMYTDEELKDKTFDKFMATQLRLATVDSRSLKSTTFTVLQRARSIIAEILRDFDPSDSESFCRFSTRATVGNPARDAYLDHKLADPITGSPEHIKWFKSHLRRHGYLAGVIEQCSPTGEPIFEMCESLPLVGVPKSYKSERLISPNTLIGSYRTYGLGCILVRALRAVGLDIAKLQSIHRKLAKRASKDRRLVTADLSSASESFLWSLIARLMPRKWLRWLNEGRLKYFHKDGRRYSYCSFMAMGIGFTFPLQTLLFYAIICSIRDLLKVKGICSVYGDDLIYPTEIHQHVKAVLTDLGMELNNDKTFVEPYFRESCGGDYYHGVDVRPFSPEGGYQELSPRKYEAWLYQLVNGLQARWDLDMLPLTKKLFEDHIQDCVNNRDHTNLIKQVPQSYPDYSGWRKDSPETHPDSGYAPVLVTVDNGNVSHKITHLTQTPKKRYVSFEIAYLYDWLRSRDCGEPDEFASVYVGTTFGAWLKHENWRRKMLTNKWFTTTRASLSLVKCPKQPKRYRSVNGKRLQRKLAVSPCKLEVMKIQTNVTDSIGDWI